MTAGPRQVEIHGSCLIVAGLASLTFHRTPQSACFDAPPRSHGLAPLTALAAGAGADVAVATDDDDSLWLSLESREAVALRFAVVAETVIDAVSGGEWSDRLSQAPQNYVVVPPQRALDGIQIDRLRARPIARAPRIEGVARCELLRVALLPGRGRSTPAPIPRAHGASVSTRFERGVPQQVLPDPFGADHWDMARASRTVVRLVGYESFERVVASARTAPERGPGSYGGWHLP